MRSNSRLSSLGTPQKILAGKRVSIPDEIMKDWKIDVGSYVLVGKEGKRMYIAPAKFEEAS